MLRIHGGQTLPKEVLVPSPSYGLNYALGGGFLSGRFHFCWGTQSSGKTSVLLHTIANAQEMGYEPFIIDAEGTLTDEWMGFCGIDRNNREYIRSNTAEDILNELIPEMRKDKKLAILIDSINMIEFESFYKTADGTAGMAGGARARGMILQKMQQYVDPEKHFIFIISQQYRDLGAYGAPLSGKLSEKERHAATNIIKLFASNSKDGILRDKETEKILRRTISWTVEKSKQAAVQGMKGNYFFCPQTAEIDKSEELIDIAVTAGVIEKLTSKTYQYRGEKFVGLENLKEAIRSTYMKDIENDLNALDSIKFEVEDDES